MAENNTGSSTGKWLIKNMAGAAIFFAALAFAAMLFLSFFTRHGKTIIVPDMANVSIEQADSMARSAGIRIEVTDSVFVRRMQKGAVYRQNPAAGSEVKKGRRIMLTINAFNAKKVSMPNLVGYSLRQAQADLNSRGLTIGKLSYQEDMATNNVLGQQFKGKNIEPGTSIESGSAIDLIVGLDEQTGYTNVPKVVGMKYVRAMDAIHSHSLNIRRCVFDKNVKTYSDSLDAVVTRQSPEASQAPIIMGSEITLYLSLEDNN